MFKSDECEPQPKSKKTCVSLMIPLAGPASSDCSFDLISVGVMTVGQPSGSHLHYVLADKSQNKFYNFANGVN